MSASPCHLWRTLLAVLLVSAGVTACDPTDPENNGYRFYLKNGSAQTLKVSLCGADCTQGETWDHPMNIRGRSCYRILVGLASLNSGYSMAVTNPRGLKTFHYIQPKPEETYSIEDAGWNTLEAALKQEDYPVTSGACPAVGFSVVDEE
jgi:hypothetical protein